MFFWGIERPLVSVCIFNTAQETQESFKIDPASEVWTGTFRDSHPFNPEGPNPENSLTGTIFTVARSRQECFFVFVLVDEGRRGSLLLFLSNDYFHASERLL